VISALLLCWRAIPSALPLRCACVSQWRPSLIPASHTLILPALPRLGRYIAADGPAHQLSKLTVATRIARTLAPSSVPSTSPSTTRVLLAMECGCDNSYTTDDQARRYATATIEGVHETLATGVPVGIDPCWDYPANHVCFVDLGTRRTPAAAPGTTPELRVTLNAM
jgi:hypothetical protein